MAVWLSVVQWRPRGVTRFVGLGNYSALFPLEEFRKALWNSAYYTIMTVPVSVTLALLVAILIYSVRSGAARSFLQAVFYLPGVISGLAIAVVWRFILDYQIGLLNYFVTSLFGIAPVNWLGDVHTALPSLALMAVVGGHGTAIIIFVAALLGIPKDLYDAAAIDGAGFWQRHWSVTIPLVVPSFLYILVVSTLGAIQVFTPVYVLTRGGPLYSTMTAGYFIYYRLVYWGDAGSAAAAGLVLLLLTVGLTIVQFRLFSRVVEF
ncbi:MAG: carbohydrate ABC transporter permease [Anaerolineae bacterium]